MRVPYDAFVFIYDVEAVITIFGDASAQIMSSMPIVSTQGVFSLLLAF